MGDTVSCLTPVEFYCKGPGSLLLSDLNVKMSCCSEGATEGPRGISLS